MAIFELFIMMITSFFIAMGILTAIIEGNIFCKVIGGIMAILLILLTHHILTYGFGSL